MQNPLGKTAFYDPEAKSVTLYITGRHPKDILRSLVELVHHKQNCDGQFDNAGEELRLMHKLTSFKTMEMMPTEMAVCVFVILKTS